LCPISGEIGYVFSAISKAVARRCTSALRQSHYYLPAKNAFLFLPGLRAA
jgi:hypothetical protein